MVRGTFEGPFKQIGPLGSLDPSPELRPQINSLNIFGRKTYLVKYTFRMTILLLG